LGPLAKITGINLWHKRVSSSSSKFYDSPRARGTCVHGVSYSYFPEPGSIADAIFLCQTRWGGGAVHGPRWHRCRAGYEEGETERRREGEKKTHNRRWALSPCSPP